MVDTVQNPNIANTSAATTTRIGNRTFVCDSNKCIEINGEMSKLQNADTPKELKDLIDRLDRQDLINPDERVKISNKIDVSVEDALNRYYQSSTKDLEKNRQIVLSLIRIKLTEEKREFVNNIRNQINELETSFASNGELSEEDLIRVGDIVKLLARNKVISAEQKNQFLKDLQDKSKTGKLLNDLEFVLKEVDKKFIKQNETSKFAVLALSIGRVKNESTILFLVDEKKLVSDGTKISNADKPVTESFNRADYFNANKENKGASSYSEELIKILEEISRSYKAREEKIKSENTQDELEKKQELQDVQSALKRIQASLSGSDKYSGVLALSDIQMAFAHLENLSSAALEMLIKDTLNMFGGQPDIE
jgi:hypothetical protein